MPFSLLSLNLEDCGLSAKDFRFLASSQHRNTLTELNIGDLDMGDDKFGHILHLIKSVPRVRQGCLVSMKRLFSSASKDHMMDSSHRIISLYTDPSPTHLLSPGYVHIFNGTTKKHLESKN